MSQALETRAELIKLARLLEVGEHDLDYLAEVPPAALRKLRDQAADVIFAVEAGLLARVAQQSHVFPSQLVAAVTREAVGPLLTARIAGLVDAERAVEVVGRLSPKFLADVATQMDPRRASEVIGAMPLETIVPVTKELVRRKEYVAMGSFVGHLDDEAIVGALEVIDDPALLKIAFVMEDKRRLTPCMALLSDERLAGIIRAAAAESLWPEAIDLLINLSKKQYVRVIDIVTAQRAAVLDSLTASVYEHDLWYASIPIAGDTSDPAAISDSLVRAQAKVFRAMVDAVEQHAMHDDIERLLDRVSDTTSTRFLTRAAKLGTLERLVPAAQLASTA